MNTSRERQIMTIHRLLQFHSEPPTQLNLNAQNVTINSIVPSVDNDKSDKFHQLINDRLKPVKPVTKIISTTVPTGVPRIPHQSIMQNDQFNLKIQRQTVIIHDNTNLPPGRQLLHTSIHSSEETSDARQFVNRVSQFVDQLFSMDNSFFNQPLTSHNMMGKVDNSSQRLMESFEYLVTQNNNKLDALLETFKEIVQYSQKMGNQDQPSSLIALTIVSVTYEENIYKDKINNLEQSSCQSFEEIVANIVDRLLEFKK